MNPSLTEFRDKYRELLLNFLWRQWSALGVAGHSRSDDPWMIHRRRCSCSPARWAVMSRAFLMR